MEATQHTPGPWKLCAHLADHDKCSCGYRGGIWGADGECIVCEMGSAATPGQEGLEPPRYPRDVEFANARLIAAAPEMFKALKEAVDIIESHSMFDATPLHELIAKVEGRSADPVSAASAWVESIRELVRGAA